MRLMADILRFTLVGLLPLARSLGCRKGPLAMGSPFPAGSEVFRGPVKYCRGISGADCCEESPRPRRTHEVTQSFSAQPAEVPTELKDPTQRLTLSGTRELTTHLGAQPSEEARSY